MGRFKTDKAGFHLPYLFIELDFVYLVVLLYQNKGQPTLVTIVHNKMPEY